MRPHLKLFTGEDPQSAWESPKVSIKLGEVCQILADASRFKRTWIHDFADDEIEISEDLYEVLCAYWQLRPGA